MYEIKQGHGGAHALHSSGLNFGVLPSDLAGAKKGFAAHDHELKQQLATRTPNMGSGGHLPAVKGQFRVDGRGSS